MNDTDGDHGGNHVSASGPSGENDAAADFGHPPHPNPIDERVKINGAPVINQSHEIVIKSDDAKD